MQWFTRQILRDRRGTSLLEFGLLAPIFIGTIFAALEMAQFVIANQRMQRIAASLGDLVAQSGTASIGASESQINDILGSLSYAAKPFKLKERGRVIVTAVQGQKNPNATPANTVQNRKLWHRCNGSLANAGANMLPGAVNTWITLPNNRVLLEGEILIHSQLVYQYEPLTNINIGNLWSPNNQLVKRSASFRPRSKTFVAITPDGSTPKSNCPS